MHVITDYKPHPKEWVFFEHFDQSFNSALRRVPCPLSPSFEHILFMRGLSDMRKLFTGQSITNSTP